MNPLMIAKPAYLTQAEQVYLSEKAKNTQIAYSKRLEKFYQWFYQQPEQPFTVTLSDYVRYLIVSGLSARSVQAHLNTVKGLFRKAALIDPSLSAYLPQLAAVKPPKTRGDYQGNRLTSPQRQSLINKPDPSSKTGRRDVCMLGLMSLCGLRESEICNLNWGHIKELDGHKVIRNLVGKHGRRRTIKLPVPLWRNLMIWAEYAGIDTSEDAPVFVRMARWDSVRGGRLTVDAVYSRVKMYGASIDRPEIAPHDLRRTAAKLARKGGASIEQVQVMLGHANPQITSSYIGETLDLDDHAVDYGDLEFPS
jgi:integrase/recombinase XerD